MHLNFMNKNIYFINLQSVGTRLHAHHETGGDLVIGLASVVIFFTVQCELWLIFFWK